MTFHEEVESVVGVEMKSWTFVGDDIALWFKHRPREDGVGQPLSWEQLEALNDEYGVVNVQSDSDGATGSVLRVTIRDEY